MGTLSVKTYFTFVLGLLIFCSNHGLASALPVFPDAKILSQSDSESSYYRLALGPQKKISNVWRAETLQSHLGQLQRLTLEMPAGFSLEDGVSYYQQALELSSLELLYTCSGRGCGSSNSWANNHFLVKQLYGLDQTQQYRAYKSLAGEYLVLYAVQRGNKRNYIQLERLLPKVNVARASAG